MNNIKVKSWWRWFWGTIISLFVLYAAALYLENYGSNNYDIKTEDGRKNYSKKMFLSLKKISPELEKYISNLSQQSKVDIKKRIHQEISVAYAPLYSQGIQNFSEFHYSVSGEYIELYNASKDGARKYLKMQKEENFDALVYEMLFESTKFNKHLKNAYTNVNNFAMNEIIKNVGKLHSKVQKDLNITKEQTLFLVEELLKIGQEDMEARFQKELSIGVHAGGLGSGAVIGAMASKQIAKMFAKKMATKAAIKTSSKLAGAAVGATTGGVEGLVCGPGAPICSSVGAVIGGIVGWFATDKIIVQADHYFNGDEFEKELKTMIEKQQQRTEEQLYKLYTNSIDAVNKVDKKRLEIFKHTQNKEYL